jgi:hypothetical protein
MNALKVLKRWPRRPQSHDDIRMLTFILHRLPSKWKGVIDAESLKNGNSLAVRCVPIYVDGQRGEGHFLVPTLRATTAGSVGKCH